MAYPTLPSLDVLTDYRPKIPLRVFTADGHLIYFAGSESEFHGLFRALGHPEWCTDERFNGAGLFAPGNRELPLIVGGLPVLPRHYWTAKDDKGEPRDLARGSLEVPIGA